MPATQKQTDHSGKQPKQDLSGNEQLIQEIEALQKKLEAADLDRKRALADYLNLQRRTQENQEKFVKLACATLVERLLEPLDHLEMTAVHINDTTLNTVMKQFQQALQLEGVEEIRAQGKPFDSKMMEAVESVDGEKDIVVRVRRKGYTLNGMMLRPAFVEVGNGNIPQKEK